MPYMAVYRSDPDDGQWHLPQIGSTKCGKKLGRWTFTGSQGTPIETKDYCPDCAIADGCAGVAELIRKARAR